MRLVLLLLILACLPGTAGAEPRTALSMHGAPRHAAGLAHFSDVNPDAPKGGRLTLGVQGNFDNLNPFIIKGVTPGDLREYVFQGLMARSPDEPFSLYGLVAESYEMPDDRSAITFHLNPAARFSDGQPVTAADVLFSYEILRDKGWPFHRSHYRKVAKAEALDAATVRFTFAAAGDREIPLIMALLPVLPRHKYDADSFERTTLEPPVGSGPYVVAAVDPGRSFTLRRNPDWWARDLPVARGRYNFDEIRFDFFRDTASLFEAFKAGSIDLRQEDDAGRWADGYGFAAVADGRVKREELAVGTPAGMQGLVFNTRRAAFADARVRRALILLFNAEAINRYLYNGLYRRTQSYFERSALSSHGRPADARERGLLAPYPDAVTPAILDGTFAFPRTDGSQYDRTNMQSAFALLRQAGYVLDNGRLVNGKTGAQFSFEFLAQTRAQERLIQTYAETLGRLGIAVGIRQVDTSQYWSRLKSFDFDMIQWSYSASLSPGNEQWNRWGSGAAAVDGSLNYAGASSPAIDAMIEAMLAATTEEDFTSAVRAFDRVLLSGDYVVPLFYLPQLWVAYWSRLKHPASLPLAGLDLSTWWAEDRP